VSQCRACAKPLKVGPHYVLRGCRTSQFCDVICRNRLAARRKSKVRMARYAGLKAMGATPEQAHYGSLSGKREAEIRGMLKP
jgi:hypothetical protein